MSGNTDDHIVGHITAAASSDERPGFERNHILLRFALGVIAAAFVLAACGSADLQTQDDEDFAQDIVETTTTTMPDSLSFSDQETADDSSSATDDENSDEDNDSDDRESQATTTSNVPEESTTTTGVAESTTTSNAPQTITAPPTVPPTTAPRSTVPSTTAAPPTTASTPAPTPGADRVIGNGSPASCTGAAVVAAVAAGGVITFDCGPNPITIPMTQTAKVINSNGPEIVIDGGGLVTLDGQNSTRILYMNTCDQAQVWTTPHCDNQDHPRLTVQNMTFINGNATGQHEDGGGGGAIFSRGGRLTVTNSTFDNNRCDSTGPDVGGAALRVFDQFNDQPVEIRGSTFRNGVCSNGGAISSIGVSWLILDSVFTGNRAIGNGANPAQAGTPGGGSGGAIYLDGNFFTLVLRNTQIISNTANEGGGAIFFVSNNRTGTLDMNGSTLSNNPSNGFETQGLPGIFYLGNGNPSLGNSTLE